jgi:hypothetical protein
MAALGHRGSRLVELAEAVGRAVLVCLFTGVEVVALCVWLELGASEPMSATAALGLSLLVAGLTLEHFLAELAANGLRASVPATGLLAVSAAEAVVWWTGLAVASAAGGPDGLLYAGVALAVLFVPQHAAEQRVLGHGVTGVGLAGRSLSASVLEAAGAVAWLGLAPGGPGGLVAGVEAAGPAPGSVGVSLLGVALLLEHGATVGTIRLGQGKPG